MLNPTPFEIIADYCVRERKNDCVRDLAYSIYRQQFESLTQNRTPPADPATVAATEQTLLSAGSLLAHVRSAEEILRKQFEDDLKPIKQQAAKSSFWFAVITSIVANIIYSLLLIILFIVAKDQLSSWLSSLVVNKSPQTDSIPAPSKPPQTELLPQPKQPKQN